MGSLIGMKVVVLIRTKHVQGFNQRRCYGPRCAHPVHRRGQQPRTQSGTVPVLQRRGRRWYIPYRKYPWVVLYGTWGIFVGKFG